MLHATTWESCPAELLLSAAAPEDTGKDARLLEQLKQQNRRGLERVMKRYTAYVGTILRNVTRGQTTQENLEELTADVFMPCGTTPPRCGRNTSPVISPALPVPRGTTGCGKTALKPCPLMTW